MLSGAVDFGLSTRTSLPLGIVVGYLYDSFSEISAEFADGIHSAFVRFSYLGRDDFLPSLDISSERVPVTADGSDLDGASVTIGLRYYS